MKGGHLLIQLKSSSALLPRSFRVKKNHLVWSVYCIYRRCEYVGKYHGKTGFYIEDPKSHRAAELIDAFN